MLHRAGQLKVFEMMTFGQRLRDARKSAGYRTAQAFATEIGLDQNRYTRYERGEVEPNLFVLRKIVEHTNASADWLLDTQFAKVNRSLQDE
ncbi:MAG: helix-turn-helix transcriptional regulator [Pseudomonadota bacterium]